MNRYVNFNFESTCMFMQETRNFSVISFSIVFRIVHTNTFQNLVDIGLFE